MNQTVIAIDGPAASGKGTVAKAISQKLQFNYLDTGKLYRTIGAKYLEGFPPITAAQGLNSNELDKYDLQKPEIAQAASEIASIPEVRAALLGFQRNFSQKMPGAVLDGRDIGTIVCPDAKIKIFLTASLEARAKRRYIELNKLDQKIRLETILDQIRERDERDQTRSSSPMVAASDAKIIDTSDLSIKEAVQKVFRYIQKKINS
jgi:cytidylate kinase